MATNGQLWVGGGGVYNGGGYAWVGEEAYGKSLYLLFKLL